MTKMKITLFMLAAIAGCLMMGSVSAMTHIVGGGHGWRLPDNQTFFEEWAKPRTFGVGDRLGKFNALAYLELQGFNFENKLSNMSNQIIFLFQIA